MTAHGAGRDAEPDGDGGVGLALGEQPQQRVLARGEGVAVGPCAVPLGLGEGAERGDGVAVRHRARAPGARHEHYGVVEGDERHREGGRDPSLDHRGAAAEVTGPTRCPVGAAVLCGRAVRALLATRAEHHDAEACGVADALAGLEPQGLRAGLAAVVEDEDVVRAAQREGPRGTAGPEDRVPLRRGHAV